MGDFSGQGDTLMPQRFTVSGSLGVSLGAIVVIAGFTVVTVPTLIVPIGAATRSNDQEDGRLSTLLSLHAKSVIQSRERFVGRSPFFPPHVPTPEPTKIPVASQPAVAETSLPVVYRGPRMIGLVGDEAWFHSTTADDLVLRVPIGGHVSDLGVVHTNPPWSARVLYQGHEFDLTLWNRMNDDHFIAPHTRPIRGLRLKPNHPSTIDGGTR
jgi:hypothetical protein